MRNIIAVILLLVFVQPALAQIEFPLEVEDLSGISLLAFGDSITYGLGDGISVGADIDGFDDIGSPGGYPKRVANTLGISVSNSGKPGEYFITEGVERFATSALGSSANLVGFMEGANDAIRRSSSSEYRNRAQKVINATIASGRSIILITTPPTCCNHAGQAPFINAYNNELRDLARINNVPLADVAFAWATTCQNDNECELFNLPEGLHPNTRGYDVMAQTVMGTLFGIDLFAEGGALQLEELLGLAPGTIIVRPVPIVTAE